MFNGKNKLLSFTFDDGLRQDARLISLFNTYGLKGTFHLNSGLLGTKRLSGDTLVEVVEANEVKQLYAGHEVAAHTLTHPLLTRLSDDEIVVQVENDRLALERIIGDSVVGFAYPCGGRNADSRVVDVIRRCTGVCYARSNRMSHGFSLSADRYCMEASVHIWSFDTMLSLSEKFLALPPETSAVFNVMGHSVELDVLDKWGAFEAVCERLAGRPDIAYVTNREIYEKG